MFARRRGHAKRGASHGGVGIRINNGRNGIEIRIGNGQDGVGTHISNGQAARAAIRIEINFMATIVRVGVF